MPPPKDVHNLVPASYEYVMLHGKRCFADVIKVMDFLIGRKPWIIWAAQSNYMNPFKNRELWLKEEEMKRSSREAGKIFYLVNKLKELIYQSFIC